MSEHAPHSGAHAPNAHLLPMLALMFVFTYTVMTAVMLDRMRDFNNNINKVWMSLLMVTLMLVIEGIVARRDDLLVAGVVATLLVVAAIRAQFGVNTSQFLKSMIEHHSAALLMSRRILHKTSDPRVAALAASIIASQAEEIRYMRFLLRNPARTTRHSTRALH